MSWFAPGAVGNGPLSDAVWTGHADKDLQTRDGKDQGTARLRLKLPLSFSFPPSLNPKRYFKCIQVIPSSASVHLPF